MTAPHPSRNPIIGNHPLHLETQMLNYGYDPENLSEVRSNPGLPDVDFRLQISRGWARFLPLHIRSQRTAGR